MKLTYTSADLALEVLSQLGETGEGQTPSDDDVTLVSNKFVACINRLSELEVVTVDDLENIQPSVFLPLAAYVAEQCAPDFGRPKNLANEQVALRELRLIVRGRPTYEPQRTDYF